jgi:hypothetical protein
MIDRTFPPPARTPGPDDVDPPPRPDPPVEGQDTTNPAAQPHGTTRDQVKNMENEGQAQPQADEVPPEDVERPPSTTRP